MRASTISVIHIALVQSHCVRGCHGAPLGIRLSRSTISPQFSCPRNAMNEQTQKTILEHFCSTHHIPQLPVESVLSDVICATSAPYFLLIECLDHLDPTNPAAGILVKMIDRTYQTAAGSLVLLRLSHVREAEVARTVFESATTVAYIARETPEEQISTFIQNMPSKKERRFGGGTADVVDWFR